MASTFHGYQRLALKTHVISEKDDIVKVVSHYTNNKLQPADTVFISERVVAITQGRAIPITKIKPSWWANFLVKFVYKPSWGIGIGSPWTIELAIREAGLWRILLAGAVAATTRPLGIRGLFYRIVGHGVNAIDGPTSYTLPPGNKSATLGPKDPDKVAQKIKDKIGVEVVIIDANDIGVRVEGATVGVDRKWACAVFTDNPLGQSHEQTPIAIVRKV